MTLKSVVVYGSARKERRGIRAAKFLVRKLKEREHDVTLIDSKEAELPFLDLMYKEYSPESAPGRMREIGETFAAADGFLIVSAEYNHSMPAALKNLLDHYQSEYLYKPSAIVTYSGGPFGGVRGLANLRTVMSELGASSIPSAFPISATSKSFDEDGNALDESYEKRVVSFLDEYEWYAAALKAARDQAIAT